MLHHSCWAAGVAILSAGVLLTPLRAAALPLSSFHVGNSLTWDARPNAFTDFSLQRSLAHEVGFHIRTSKSLTQIAAQPSVPSEVTGVHAAPWTRIGERHFDVVTLQTYPRDATLGTETAAVVQMIDTTRLFAGNADTRFVLYGAWPTRLGDYAEHFAEPLNSGADPLADDSAAFYAALHAAVRSARPDADVAFLSTGKLLAMADLTIKASVAAGGNWHGFTDVDQLYRDDIHLANHGRWLASLAMWAAVTGQNVAGLTPPAFEFGNGSRVYTDLSLQQGFASFVDASFPSVYTPVPEPTTLGMLGLAAIVLIRRRAA